VLATAVLLACGPANARSDRALAEPTGHYALASLDRWIPPNELLGPVADLAYAREDRLVIVRDPGRFGPAESTAVLDPEGNAIGAWPPPPGETKWLPSTVTSIPGSFVHFGFGPSSVVQYTPSGSFVAAWDDTRLPPIHWSRRLRSGPGGEVFGVRGIGPDWSPVARWLPDGRLEGTWSSGDPGHPAFGVLSDFATGAEGGLLLLDQHGQIHATDANGRTSGRYTAMWPSELVPADDGNPEM